MKTIILKTSSAIFLMAALAMTSCEDEQKVMAELDAGDEISAAVIQRFQDLYFDTQGMKMVGRDYLVEDDIIVTPEALANMSDPIVVNGPKGEQYRTYNLVSTPRTIRVRGSGLTSKMSTALDWAIANYNRLNLGFAMQRVSSGADITVRQASGGAGGVAGFPYGDGRPYSSVTIYSGTNNYDTNVVEHVITHELGHCVGLRHTDWFNRAYSCGSGGSEGSGSVGAVHIPGTPTSYDSNSIMLSCFSSTEDGEFSYYDQVGLQYLY